MSSEKENGIVLNRGDAFLWKRWGYLRAGGGYYVSESRSRRSDWLVVEGVFVVRLHARVSAGEVALYTSDGVDGPWEGVAGANVGEAEWLCSSDPGTEMIRLKRYCCLGSTGCSSVYVEVLNGALVSE